MTDTVLDRVLARHGRTCRCAGQCGKPHRYGTDQCGQSGTHHKPLVAAPEDAGLSDLAAARLPVEQLVPWCAVCLTAARGKARKARAEQQAAELADAQLGLFADEPAA